MALYRNMTMLAHYARLFAWAGLAGIMVLTLVPARWRPSTTLPHDVEHFAVFLLLGVAFGLAYPARRGTLLLCAIGFASLVEAIQIVVPGRHARVSDLIVDALGGCLGILLAVAVDQIRRALRP